MGEMPVMEVETGEIKASHTGTAVQYAGKRVLKHKQKHKDIKKNKKSLSSFFLKKIWMWCPQCTGNEQ